MRISFDKVICNKCGGDNVEIQATVMFDARNKQFTVVHLYEDGAYCVDCQSEVSYTLINRKEE